jgi:hypothetical protein
MALKGHGHLVRNSIRNKAGLKIRRKTKGKIYAAVSTSWFELQVAQQSLLESFAAGQRTANAANLDAPSSTATRRAASEKQLPGSKSADPLKRRTGRESIFRLVKTSVYLVVGAIIYEALRGDVRAADTQPIPLEPVSVVHPEKSGTATLQLSGQLWAYTDAPIYAQTCGYLTSWAFDIGEGKDGDGGEQNAPLGRAVIGGLIFATATLFLVPTVFMLVNKIKRFGAQGVSAAERALG